MAPSGVSGVSGGNINRKRKLNPETPTDRRFLASFDKYNTSSPEKLSTCAGSREPLLVLQVMRYYVEPTSRRIYGLDGSRFYDVFDITVTDHINRRTFVLTADVFTQHKIKEGSQIRLRKVSQFSKDFNDENVTFYVIHDLEVLEEPLVPITDSLKSLPVVPSSMTGDKTFPLASDRPYFMDNWTFNLSQAVDVPTVKTVSMEQIDLGAVCSIKDAVQKKAAAVRNPCLLVKVMRRSNLVNYINSRKEDKWPFQLPLLVADSSGWCPAVMWNRLGVQFYQQVQEGSLLLMRNFRLKPSMQQKTQSYFPPPQGVTVFSSEIALNIHHPRAEVVLVDADENSVKRLKLPRLQVKLMSRKDLISVPDFTVVDVGGLITYVGQVERESRRVSKFGSIDSGGFFYRRWLHVRDKSVDEPIIILAYSGDQVSTLFKLRPGQHVVCRNMLSNQQLGDLTSSRQCRYGWLTTTTNSWIYIIEDQNDSNIPAELKNALKKVTIKNPLKYSHLYKEGGIFRYPPSSTEMDPFLDSQPERFEQGNRATWGECRRLVLHAVFKGVSHIQVRQPRVPSPHLMSPRKQSCRADGASTSRDVRETDDIPQSVYNIWPRSLHDKRKNPRSVLKLDWCEEEPTNAFSTWKPCTLLPSSSQSQIDSLLQLMAGQYDDKLGLAGLSRMDLIDREVSRIIQQSSSLVGTKFAVQVDAYTDRENQQVLVLDRAFKL